VLGERDVPDSVDHDQRHERQPPELGVEGILALRRATYSVAVANWTLWPATQARIEFALARWGLACSRPAEQHDVLLGV
jgi:hypothetical protein